MQRHKKKKNTTKTYNQNSVLESLEELVIFDQHPENKRFQIHVH